MDKIGVLGKKESLMLFRLGGTELFFASEKDGAKEGLKKLKESGCGVIFITDDFGKEFSDECEKYKMMELPSVVRLDFSRSH